ncbi:uncharacterized protein LOC123874180 isoform X2 [Maniola jurtina]|uniref:uncharacterized protein LOC123874180 isoform X2 n=1 Tax=Maniola jurtina TaxID=191418 RepID=UPI001E687147|nr:uncharacterized protein LOC123874180 isoform X2 [Maniola jurtina]
MDGSPFEHSDSESGDSWTLLEHSPSPGDDAPDFAEHPSERTENHEKDEDTDGISIISDSDPESPSPCQLNEHYLPDDNRPTEHEITQCISADQPLIITKAHHESVEEDDLLLVDNIKHRTYVHRRNKRLSTVLNIIVLGSVITAAGVAIGHMWGAKTDCSMHTTPTVNKILSNLYKLQEENAYLRSKLKELTASNNYQLNLQKANSKQNRCRKMFEESLNNDNIDKLTKCLDDKFDDAEKLLNSHLVDPSYEKEFISDMDKLKNVYLQNKSWLDDEINQRLKQEEESLKRLKNKHFSKLHKINEEKNINIINEQEIFEKPLEDSEVQHESINEFNDGSDRIISYADSLKSTDKMKKMVDNENNKTYEIDNKEINNNKKLKGDFGPRFDRSVSEEEFKKDNRYKSQKFKPEKKKYDRQKSHKKQKRKNKYEQWEMKGGFMKDYDEISSASLQEAESVTKNDNYKYNIEENITDLKDNTKVDKNTDTIDVTVENYSTKRDKALKRGNSNEVHDSSWFDKRAALRTEARKRLEYELFGESPNTAGWYFRRMHKREQCRAKADNSTYRKLLKRNMNFKMKH